MVGSFYIKDRCFDFCVRIVYPRDQTIVTVFYGSDGKNARIMVMAGEDAVKNGVDAGQVVQKTSTIINGGGGGKSNFAQGGGTEVEKLPEAIEKAMEVLKDQLKP